VCQTRASKDKKGDNAMTIRLRAGRPADAEACGLICYQAFQTIANAHSFPPDFPVPEAAIGLMSHLFARTDAHSVVAEVDGRVAGSNFLWESAAIAGVGPITVAPGLQNASVGRQLMAAVMERARDRGFAGVRLVQAAYHGRSLSLYLKLGFDAREPLTVVQGPAMMVNTAGVRSAGETDLDACNSLCLRVHGHHRGPELLQAVKQGTAMVMEDRGRITGYATTIGFLGHAVGENNEALKALIASAKEFPGPGFLVPTRNSELLRWCLANGLRIVQPMTLMSVGLYNEPQGAFLPSVIY
jgi:GNAT superfamily N-acetyltransferase